MVTSPDYHDGTPPTQLELVYPTISYVGVLDNDLSPDPSYTIIYYSMYYDVSTYDAWEQWALYNRLQSNNNVWYFRPMAIALKGIWPNMGDIGDDGDFYCIWD